MGQVGSRPRRLGISWRSAAVRTHSDRGGTEALFFEAQGAYFLLLAQSFPLGYGRPRLPAPTGAPVGREHPGYPLTRNRWEDRPFRPAITSVGWIVYGEVPSYIRLDYRNQERLTGCIPLGRPPRRRDVECEEDAF